MKKHLLIWLWLASGVLAARACGTLSELENAVRVTDESAVIV